MATRIGTLAGPALKLDRAKKHLRDLNGMWRWFCETDPYTLTPENNPESGQPELVVTRVEPLPRCIPILAGDTIHNLRAALDQLIRQLIVANGRKPDNNSEFPIGHDETDYLAKKRRKTRGIGENVANFFDAMQPYKGGQGHEFFWVIHCLDIVDKHRLLLTTVTSHSLIVRNDKIVVWDKDDPEARVESLSPGEVLEPRDPPLLRVGSRYQDNEGLEVAPLVALNESWIGERKPLISTLHRLVERAELLITACAEGEPWGGAAAEAIRVIPPS